MNSNGVKLDSIYTDPVLKSVITDLLKALSERPNGSITFHWENHQIRKNEEKRVKKY